MYIPHSVNGFGGIRWQPPSKQISMAVIFIANIPFISAGTKLKTKGYLARWRNGNAMNRKGCIDAGSNPALATQKT